MPSKRLVIIAYALATIVVIAGVVCHAVAKSNAARLAERRRAAMAKVLPAFRINGGSLQQALADLSQQTGQRLGLDVTELQAAGYDGKEQLYLTLFDTSFDRVLKATLASAVVGIDMASYWDGGTLRVSTAESRWKQAFLHAYDVSDLSLDPYLKFTEAPSFSLSGSSGGGSMFEPPTPRDLEVERRDLIVKLITTTVSPESWRDAGGTIGIITFVGPTLLISQTSENHAHIGQLLRDLREDSREP